MKNGAPGRIRTSDPQIRSLVFYPAELRVRKKAEQTVRCDLLTTYLLRFKPPDFDK